MDSYDNHKFANLSEDDVRKITDLENKISSETGEDTILIAYSKRNG